MFTGMVPMLSVLEELISERLIAHSSDHQSPPLLKSESDVFLILDRLRPSDAVVVLRTSSLLLGNSELQAIQVN